MRITCDLETSNRLCASLNMKGKGKPGRSQLSVGRKPGSDSKDGEVYIMICTKQDRNGTKYILRNNVEQIFGKFVSEGKATVRLAQPAIDLCLSKADPMQLKGFLSIIRLGHRGDNLEKVSLSCLAPASAKTVERLKTRLSISSRKDYPVTTGFPSALEVLHVQQCTLKKVDSRMLQLRNLRVLNLSHNRLQCLPEDWDQLIGLTEFHLADNLLSELPQGFCTGNLSNSLTLLDLSKNKIKFLRPFFCKLQKLVTLRLSENELACLPSNLGQLMALRYLSLTQNQLRVLPATFCQLRLEELDMFANAFLQDGPGSIINRLDSNAGLLELAARAIKKYRIRYTQSDLPGHLYEMLNLAKLCPCGSVCFRSFVHYLARLDLHRVAASLTAIDQAGRTHAPVEAFLCSQMCFVKYQKNPYATIWKR